MTMAIDAAGGSSVRFENHLPADVAGEAARLYLFALSDRLAPVFGHRRRARRSLADGFDRRMCVTASIGRRLVGVLGIRTESAGFINVSWGALRPHYGLPGSLWRLALLSILHRPAIAGEAVVDGIVVSPSVRGKGIGRGLLTVLENWAHARGLAKLRLELTDGNRRAKTLFRRFGFVDVDRQTVWPFGGLTGCRAATVMLKALVA
jgi:GNAT superfamily N-acetyltransferase